MSLIGVNFMPKIEKIASFQIDHTKLDCGLYVSRIDGDITTYDMRMRKPNCNDYLDDISMHTFEHMLASYIRSGPLANSIIYVGPMGCRTGFYLLVRNADNITVWAELCRVMESIINHNGEVFGASKIECGNYLCLDLDTAKAEAKRYYEIIKNQPKSFEY